MTHNNVNTTKRETKERNARMLEARKSGASIAELSERFWLTELTVIAILRKAMKI